MCRRWRGIIPTSSSRRAHSASTVRRRARTNWPMRRCADRHGAPVGETQAGKGALAWDHPLQVGAIGVTGSPAANALASDADLVLAVGTRLQDFTTGSNSLFARTRGV